MNKSNLGLVSYVHAFKISEELSRELLIFMRKYGLTKENAIRFLLTRALEAEKK